MLLQKFDRCKPGFYNDLVNYCESIFHRNIFDFVRKQTDNYGEVVEIHYNLVGEKFANTPEYRYANNIISAFYAGYNSGFVNNKS